MRRDTLLSVRTWFLLVLLLCVSVPAEGGQATPEERARAEFARGEAAYVSADFLSALRAFEEAYRLSHRAALLYNIGVCLEKLGRFPQAVAEYKRYLTEGPDPNTRGEVQARVTALEASIAQAQELDSAGRAQRRSSGRLDTSSSSPTRAPRRSRVWVWGVVAGVAVVGVGLGVGLGLGLRRGGFEPNLPTGGPGVP